MSEPNYFNIPYSNLPSHGQLYPKCSSIRFRILQIRDLKYLAAMDEKNAFKMIGDILKRCLKVEGMDLSDIYRMDRLPIIFYLRRNTFMLSNGYQTEFDCPYCGSRVIKNFEVHNIKSKPIEESVIRKAEIGGITVSGIYRKIFDPEIRTEDPEIDLIVNWTDIVESWNIEGRDLVKKILELPADEYARLKHLASDARCGVLGYTELMCDRCMNTMKVGIDLSDDKLFNRIQLSTMIRNQIQVSKYCGITITDEMPYNEVEMMIAIVNEMSQNEAENLEKAKNKRSS